MKHQIIKLYSNCMIVCGAVRAVICDLQRNTYYPVPLAFAELFDHEGILHLQQLHDTLDEEDRDTLAEYTGFLESNELAFSCSYEDALHFPGLPVEWDFPGAITHCIIDANSEPAWLTDNFLAQLENIGCNYIQFRFYECISDAYLEQVMTLINTCQVKSVDLILKHSGADGYFNFLTSLVIQNRKIRNVTVHNAKSNMQVRSAENGFGAILSICECINNQTHCGVVHNIYFSINIETFTESLQHNTCLNRKISIDADGNIKNCPSMQESFGNIKDTTLAAAIEKPGFKKYWNIPKDRITKCRDCEFRHICTDCRAYVDNPDDLFSAPLKCGYDPYTCTWEEWSTNPLKQSAIAHYGMK